MSTVKGDFFLEFCIRSVVSAMQKLMKYTCLFYLT